MSVKEMKEIRDEQKRRCVFDSMALMMKNKKEEGKDFTFAELALIDKEIANAEERNKLLIIEAVCWFSSMRPDDQKLDNVVDGKGMNPLHYALASGKCWDDGLIGSLG